MEENAPDFQEMRYSLEMMIRGKTKAEPIDGDYSEDEQEMAAGAYKKGMEFEENFDEMVVDEGVCANHMR